MPIFNKKIVWAFLNILVIASVPAVHAAAPASMVNKDADTMADQKDEADDDANDLKDEQHDDDAQTPPPLDKEHSAHIGD